MSPRAPTPPLSVAPMMERTDAPFRWILRRITRRTLLYTEMIHAGALLHGDPARHLEHDPCEHPLAVQLGGSEPDELARAARLAAAWGFDEVNLNVGCPSERVSRGMFGAVLMKHPDRVARAVEAMRRAVPIPVTVKTRIGVDDRDRYEDLLDFVDRVAAAGADRITVHARKAWLAGLSPRENRTVPPLRWDLVHRLKRDRPHLPIEINGGIRGLEEARRHLEHVDGVMLGRVVWDDPMVLARADHLFWGDPLDPPRPEEIVAAAVEQVHRWRARRPELRVGQLLRGLLHLFDGRPGARRWRQVLGQEAHAPGFPPEKLLEAIPRPRGQARRSSSVSSTRSTSSRRVGQEGEKRR